MAEYRSTSKREEVAKKMDELAGKLQEAGGSATGKISDAMRNLSDSIRNVDVSGYRDQVMDTMDNARAEVDKKVEHVKTNISEHPFESVAIAAGAGLLAGAAIAILGRHAHRKSM